MDEKKQFLIERCAAEDIVLSDLQCDQLLDYYEEVIETNKVMNLTAITEFKEFVIKHFIDSLMISKFVDMKNVSNMLDVGTGAGFPGVPLKIMFPEINILLLDSLNKRLNFLNGVIEKLGLKDISTIHTRAEELQSKGDYRESFDLVVSRAVATLPSLCEFCIPYVKCGGRFVSYKSRNADEEIDSAKKAIDVLGGRIEKTPAFTLKDTDYERCLVIIDKVKNTPKKYPRSGGKPLKSPIV